MSEPDKVLVINCGSSSVKYQLLAMTAEQSLAGGLFERIGEADGSLRHWVADAHGARAETVQVVTAADHREALVRIGSALRAARRLDAGERLAAVGHRVVHGGERFSAPTRIDAEELAQLRALSRLAPLHNPANLLGIEAGLAALPDVPQVAVFDTAFHQTMPPHAFRYPVPEDWYVRHGVRRYGFHGTSHRYVAARAAAHLGQPLAALNLITLHLGNGASAAAIRAGRCVDTSMGLTPLEGLMMGTRCGDIDAAIPLYMAEAADLRLDQVDAALNHASGLRGICGDNDMRRVQERAAAGDAAARLALDMYCYRIKKYIGAYAAILERIDAVVFTAGIGENSATVRRAVCSGLGALGIKLDEERNRAAAGEVAEIQAGGARLRVLVIRTNEELEIARQTLACVRTPARDVNPGAGVPGDRAGG